MTQRPTAPQVLSERTLRTYAAAWSLFTDWCAVTSHPELPADPAIGIAFLADCQQQGKPTGVGWLRSTTSTPHTDSTRPDDR